jgi:hypothetical protein
MSTWRQATERAIQRRPESARCSPRAGACDQQTNCAMTSHDRRGTVIDASVTRTAAGCSMFIDVRRTAMDADPRFAQ